MPREGRRRAESPPPGAPRSLKTQQRVRPRLPRAEVASKLDRRRSRQGFGRRQMNQPVNSGSAAGVRSPATTDLTTFLKTVEPAPSGAGLIPRRFFTESLILAQDERWRRA